MTKKEWAHRRYEQAKLTHIAFAKFYPLTLEDLPDEVWLPAPNYEDYQISNFGRIKSFKNGMQKILKPAIDGKGYLQAGLCKNGKIKRFRVHRLVAQLFVSNPDNKPQINHRDGNRLNNHISNLEWCTSAENIKHAVEHNLIPSCEDNYLAKLTQEQIFYIRDNPDNLTLKQLADMFGMAFQTISTIQLGKSWKNAGGIIRDKVDKRIPNKVREQIRAEYVYGSADFGSYGLAKKYGVSQKTVLNIVHE